MGFGRGAAILVQFAALIIMARHIPPYGFGLYGMASVVMGLGSVIFAFGLGYSVVREPKILRNDVSRLIAISIIFGLIGSCLLWLISPVVSALWGQVELAGILQVAAIDILLRTATVVPMSYLQRCRRFRILAQIDLAAIIFGNGVLAVYLSVIFRDYWALVFSSIAANLIRIVLLYGVLGSRLRPTLNFKGVEGVITFGGGMMVARLLNFMALNVDNILVGRILGAGALGVYSRAYNLMSQPASLVSEVYEKVIYPLCASLRNKPDKLNVLYLKSIRALMWIMIPGATLGVLMAKPIVLVLLGEDWAEVVLPLEILLVGMIARVGYTVPLVFSRVVGGSVANVKAQGFYATVVLLFSGSLISFGVVGVASGVVLALVLCNILFQIRYCLSQDISWRSLVIQYVEPSFVTVGSLCVSAALWYFIDIYSLLEGHSLRGFTRVLLFIVIFTVIVKCLIKIKYNNTCSKLISKLLKS